ncbi:hypothetical protein QP64_11660 [Staphylococcus aureus]|nr:hypothetical protein QP64_11660 [Staphylococcus aureus]
MSKRNSTGNASWGVGPNTENFEKKFYRQCKLGMGPNTENFEKKFYRQCKLGMGPNTEAVTNDKILLHNKSLVVLYHFCLPFLIVLMHKYLSSNCRIKLYLISNYP